VPVIKTHGRRKANKRHHSRAVDSHPPRFPGNGTGEVSSFDAADLRQLAARSGLFLSAKGQELDSLAVQLTLAWVNFGTLTMVCAETSPSSVSRKWGASIAEVLREALSVLGVTDGTSPSTMYSNAQALSKLGRIGLAEIERSEKRMEFERLLRLGGMLRDGENITDATLPVCKTLALMSALAMLADGLAVHSDNGKPHRNPTLSTVEEDGTYSVAFSYRLGAPASVRQVLFDCLAPIFEALHHGRKYAVSKYSSGGDGMRATRSIGPAVTWTRELFSLVADRTVAPAFLAQTVADLRRWAADKPEGFAKCIEIAGRSHREAQRRKLPPKVP
jgi:hypothetical protein